MKLFNPKRIKYTALFLSKNNEIQCVPLLCLSSRFMTYVQSFVLSKLSLKKKKTLKLGSWSKYLLIIILLKGWSVIKKFYPDDRCCYIVFLLFWIFFPELSSSKVLQLIEETHLLSFFCSHNSFSSYSIYHWRSHRLYQWISHRCYEWSGHSCHQSRRKSIFLFFFISCFDVLSKIPIILPKAIRRNPQIELF